MYICRITVITLPVDQTRLQVDKEMRWAIGSQCSCHACKQK